MKTTGLLWDEVVFSRKLDQRLGKPCWIPPATRAGNEKTKRWPVIDFNVSHQKGIVLLVGIASNATGDARRMLNEETEIAVDVVSPNERGDLASIASSGLEEFVSTFSEIFSEEEVFRLTYTLPQSCSITLDSGRQVSARELGRLDRVTECGKILRLLLDGEGGFKEQVEFDSDVIIEEKIRNFYASFSLKESYVKMGGMGLAATWIRQCEFHNVRAPARASVARCNLAGTLGETTRNVHPGDHEAGDQDSFTITMDGEEVQDVEAEIQSFEEDYLFSTMIKPRTILNGERFPAWQRVSLERDILAVARRLY